MGIDDIKDTVKEVGEFIVTSGPVKTPVTLAVGMGVSEFVKPVLQYVALAGTAIVIVLHAINAIIRQWCPVRRQKITDCKACPLYGTILCSHGTSEKD